MPEGDTIARAAIRLGRALTGTTLVRAEIRRRSASPPPGVQVTEVEAIGKHLMIRFDNGRTLHTHMQMSGTWDVHRAGDRWRRPGHQARVILGTDDGWEAVCFNAPVVEYIATVAEVDKVGHLGPDLTRAGVDLDAAVRRFDLLDPATELGVALLDQRVACGVGNVYKSDVSFIERINPFTSVGSLDGATRMALLATASRLLQANLTTPRRITFHGGLAVYHRAGRPCRRCATIVQARPQGEEARMTYWCPTCQPAPLTSGSATSGTT